MKLSVEYMRKVTEIKNKMSKLQEEGKTDEAHALIGELKEAQNKLEVQKVLEAGETTPTGKECQESKSELNENAVFNKAVMGKPLTEEEVEFLNAAGSPGQVGADNERGGYLIPSEQFTQIQELKRHRNPLKQFCNVIPVSSRTGTMPLEVDSTDELTSFEELNEINETQVKFGQVKFDTADYGDIIPVSNTLLADEKANLTAYIGKRFARKSVRTENRKIIDKLQLLTATAITDYSGITTVLNVKLDPAISDNSIILTNQNGFDYLDTQKDENGRPILTESLVNRTQKLFKGRPVVVMTNGELPNTGTGGKVIPVYVGDLSEYAAFFDREGVSVAVSTEAGFVKNATLLRAVQRFDVQVIDKEAMIRLALTVTAPA